MDFHDEEYSTFEKARMIVVGISQLSRIVVVLYYIDRGGLIEIVRARKATQKEWAKYAGR